MTLSSPVIDVATLAELPEAERLIVDCRFALDDPEGGRRTYREGHIPGAVYAHLDEDLSDMRRVGLGLGRHPLPEAGDFARCLGRWGWIPGQAIVAYDAAGGALAAARLWWLARAAGIDAAVLDGGVDAWKRAGRPLETTVPSSRPTRVAIDFDARKSVATDAVEVLRDDPRRLLLDARAAQRFRGEIEPLDRVGGHVPGARNRPFPENLQADGQFRPAAELREGFERMLGGVEPDNVVHMCGSGVTACHNLLAMEYAGLGGSRLYAPSWSGWVSDPAREIATGEA